MKELVCYRRKKRSVRERTRSLSAANRRRATLASSRRFSSRLSHLQAPLIFAQEEEGKEAGEGGGGQESRDVCRWGKIVLLEFPPLSRVPRVACVDPACRERTSPLPEGRGPWWAAPGSRRESPSSGQSHSLVPLFCSFQSEQCKANCLWGPFFFWQNFKSPNESCYVLSFLRMSAEVATNARVCLTPPLTWPIPPPTPA